MVKFVAPPPFSVTITDSQIILYSPSKCIMNWHKRVYTLSILKNHQMHVLGDFFVQLGSIFWSYRAQSGTSFMLRTPLTDSHWKEFANVVHSRRIRIKKAFGTLHATLREGKGSPESCVLAVSKSCTSCGTIRRFYCILLWLTLLHLLTLSVPDSAWAVKSAAKLTHI